jgi:hypothetical protein
MARVSGCCAPITRSWNRQQDGQLFSRAHWVARLAGPSGEAGTGHQRVGVLAAGQPLPHA